MTGDFTSVPLRSADRWTAARMQQGRVLLDTDWNLNVDGSERDARQLALDAVGSAGVPAGSSAFSISVAGGVLQIAPGTMWIDGLLARNPTNLYYDAQSEIGALPASGLAVVYLDAFVEEVQAAEDPTELLDPALDGVDTTTRTRVGWRVRAASTASATCSGATLPAALSTGTLDVSRTGTTVDPDPCAPPDDPRSKLPDGLLRVEVIDGGTESTARFAWSYADGGDAVAASVAGTAVTLAPSPSVAFAHDDLVEVSTLARRADRRDHGPLFTVSAVTPQAGGDLVTLGTASALTGNPPGTCLRRWDGEAKGAATPVTATLAGNDVGIAFTARAGSYLVGDWWGVRVRGSAADAVETFTAAPPDGIRHAMAPLAVVDLGLHTVVSDCRPSFPPLTGIRGGTCTVTVFPGDDLQGALDALPNDGGELCLAAGTYPLGEPLVVKGKRRIVVIGVGPATVLVARRHEAALVATRCDDIEITHLRVETAVAPGSPPGDAGLMGALSFFGCDGVRVHDCEIAGPDSNGRAQSGIYVVADAEGVRPGVVEIRGNRLDVGDQQVGILVTSATESTIVDNAIRLTDGPEKEDPRPLLLKRDVASELGHFIARHVSTDEKAGGRAVTLPDDQTVHVGGPAEVRRVVADWAKQTTVKRLKREPSPRTAVAKWVLSSVTEEHQASIGRGSARFLTAVLKNVRSIAQGIVIGGDRAHRVRIEGNEIVDTIQGIHVGLHDPGIDHFSADQVVISDNTVDCRIPFFWSRQRHAIYVGNVVSLTMLDNHAHLTRSGGSTDGTTVDAVRIWGMLGSWLQVRGVDLTGEFRVGVVVRDTGSGPRKGRSIRYITDVLNLDGGQAIDVPPSVVTERCLP